ncbi:hypothetical protein SH528x_002115 [Novipirellula sp. SH528]|uniref:hypothetical protein n=1 Tax=Novipirellula sp. SH528 TaxID=3454466 RepID=UPI003FA10F5A
MKIFRAYRVTRDVIRLKHKMGWSTDWLYTLLLDRARETWIEAQSAAKQRGEPVPNYLVATEHPSFNEQFTMAFGDPIRIWTSLDDFSSLADSSVLPKKSLPVDSSRSIFAIPLFAFHIAGDRKRVLISRHIGGRYGNGGWHDVIGQGNRGTLTNAGHAGWIA